MARLNSSGWKSGDLRIWSGDIENIPNGWELTQEMIDRAVVGAGGQYTKGQIFGADSRTPSINVNNHTLSQAQMPWHEHWLQSDGGGGNTSGILGTSGGGSFYGKNTNAAGSSSAHNHGASSSAVDTRQKSIAVIWIRKL